jgi:hypothetical protein
MMLSKENYPGSLFHSKGGISFSAPARAKTKIIKNNSGTGSGFWSTITNSHLAIAHLAPLLK